MKEILTPKKNKATISYTFEGIPTDGLIPLYLGYTVENNIIIQPHLREDNGLLRHELTHVDQWYYYNFFSFRYKYISDFRFKIESEAFAAQALKNENIDLINKYAHELSTAYKLNKTFKECKKSITNEYERCINEN